MFLAQVGPSKGVEPGTWDGERAPAAMAYEAVRSSPARRHANNVWDFIGGMGMDDQRAG